jgi:hypothetical protein
MLGRVNRVLVTNAEAANTGTSLNTIVNGDILVLNRGFSNLTGTPTISSAADNDVIHIAQGIGTGKAIVSLPIQLKNVTKVIRTAYSAPAEQVIHIGFNGTSGSLQAAVNNTEYRLCVLYKDDQRIMANRDTRGLYYFTSDATATLAEIASALVRKVNADKYAYVSAVLLTNGTFTALTNTAAVVKGSKTVTSTAHGLVAGDLVRIGGTTATSPVYLVKSVTDANNFVLDSVYEGASGTILAANIGKMTVVTSYGIQLTGESIAYNGIDKYSKVAFDASLYAEDQTEETVTYTTALAYGQGFWQQIRDMEYDAQGYLGVTNRTLFPTANLGSGTPSTRATEGLLYNVLTIEHFDEHTGDLQGQYKSPMKTVIAFASASAPTKSTKETAVIDILESLFESAGIFVE